MRNALLLGIISSLFACGGNPTPATQPPPAGSLDVSNTPVAAPVAAIPAGPQTPLDRLKSLGVRSGADAALVIDGEKMRGSLAGELVMPLAALATGLFGKACEFSPLDDVALVAGSFFAGPERVYLALETKHPAQDWVACAARYARMRGDTSGERSEVNVTIFNDHRIEAVADHTLVISPAADGALKASPSAPTGSLASSLDLGGDHFFEVRGDLPIDTQRYRNIRFDIGGDKSTVSAHLVFDLPNGKGVEVTELFNQGREQARSGGAPPFLPWLFDKLRYDVQGDHFEANLALERSDISKVQGIVQLFLGHGAGYAPPSGASEARNNVRQLGRLASMWFELEVPDPKNPSRTMRRTTCPPSAPLTPAKVPKGVTYQSTSADWSKPGWSGLKFSMPHPQRYSYGIETAKDGKSCKFYAVGDLDGDGKTSRFEVLAKVVPGSSLSVSPNILETRPEE